MKGSLPIMNITNIDRFLLYIFWQSTGSSIGVGEKVQVGSVFCAGDLMVFSMRHAAEKSPEDVEHDTELEDQDAYDSDYHWKH